MRAASAACSRRVARGAPPPSLSLQTRPLSITEPPPCAAARSSQPPLSPLALFTDKEAQDQFVDQKARLLEVRRERGAECHAALLASRAHIPPAAAVQCGCRVVGAAAAKCPPGQLHAHAQVPRVAMCAHRRAHTLAQPPLSHTHTILPRWRCWAARACSCATPTTSAPRSATPSASKRCGAGVLSRLHFALWMAAGGGRCPSTHSLRRLLSITGAVPIFTAGVPPGWCTTHSPAGESLI